MKKFVSIVTLVAILFTFAGVFAAQAQLSAPYGQGQIGYTAVVLCEEITVRQQHYNSAKAITTLPYGSRVIVTEEVSGWARVVLSDSIDAQSGWVNSDYIIIDPYWFKTDAKTPVYAWNSLTAPKVALLDKGVTVPVLKIEGDWIVVSLRGAAGWIHMN